MKTRMPFGGFFLKPLDEQNGTCEYEEYQRKCEEEPLTEEEQKEQAEQRSRSANTCRLPVLSCSGNLCRRYESSALPWRRPES